MWLKCPEFINGPKGTHIEVLNGRLDSLKLESEVGGLEDVRSDIRVRRQKKSYRGDKFIET